MSDHREYYYSESSEPHHSFTKKLLLKHPEIRQLIGRNPYSFLCIAFIVALQVSLAIFLSTHSWWLVVLFAYAIGAFANHGLFVLIHECSHDLIFKSRTLNLMTGILADIPNIIPSSISFRRYHLKHHSFQGVYDLDADLPSHWEAKMIGKSALGKATWLLFFPVFQILRPPRLKEIKFSSFWTWVNMIFVFSSNIILFSLFGPKALIYLGLSLVFSVGLHPLGARWIQEHYIVNYPQETYSYYGPLNRLAFNVGYHNEHHDFPSIPWNRLPKIREYAAEHYDSLLYHTSWLKLLYKFIFDSNISLFSRVHRDNRGNIKLDVRTATPAITSPISEVSM